MAKPLYQQIISQLIAGKNLTQTQSRAVFLQLFKGVLREDEAKSLLLLLSEKGETVDEILGCLKAIKELEPPIKSNISHLMDTCGTGGDNSHSFNISTVSAFVVAGAGGRVAKHGNRSISSKSGSSDLMRALGIKLDAPKKRMIEAIEKYGIGYFHAPFYHPVFAKVQPLRQKLKVRTIFNLLGPLLNPFKLKAQLVGVANANFLKTYTAVLKKLNTHKAFICHSLDGMDEITTSSSTIISSVGNRKSKQIRFNPVKYGFKKALKKAYAGGSVEKNKTIALKMLRNQMKGPLRDVILCNAGAGLYVSGVSKSFKQGIEDADYSLSSGAAYNAYVGLKKVSNKR